MQSYLDTRLVKLVISLTDSTSAEDKLTRRHPEYVAIVVAEEFVAMMWEVAFPNVIRIVEGAACCQTRGLET